jgi:serine/threonine-protein kinase
MTDPLAGLKKALADRYTIERPIGHGGMATVYLAEEHHPRRPVAIKVLSPEFATQLMRERFIREVNLVSKLIHPHIVPVFAAGEAGALLYYVMPYVEGESLQHRLVRDRVLPLPVAVKIAREVARALHYAHELGIIHRDIKPANILLLSNNEALVADFGIARAIGAATGAFKITRAGLPIGTPVYMSPEQATGEPNLDRRSDVYSLGCVLFEMLVGDPPFPDPRVQRAGTPRGSADPLDRLSTMQESVPDELGATLDKALAERPSDRFATAAEFEQALAAVRAATQAAARSESVAGRASARNRLLVGLAVAALVVIAAAVGLFRGWLGAPADDIRRPMLVVLPFQNLGPVGDGLSGLRDLGVVSRNSAVLYEGTDKTTRQIGDELGVDYILEGTIQWERLSDPTSRVRIIPQLIRVSDNTHVWAGTYDEDMAEVFRVQSDIAERVAQGLDVTVLEPERRLLRAKPTDNLEAYEYYLRGRDYLWAKGWTAQDASALWIAVDMFERAIQLDSAFALAYVELSNAHWSLFSGFIDPTEERRALWKAAVDKALELQPDLPEAHLALGLYHYTDTGQADELALGEFERVAQRQPNNALARELISMLLAASGEWDQALENAAWATDLDPRSPDRAGFAGWLHLLARRYAEAETYLNRAISLAPDQADPYSNKAILYVAWRGNSETVREVVQEMITHVSPAASALALVQSAKTLIVTGDYDSIFEQLSLSSYRGAFPFNYLYVKAEFYRLRGNPDRARAYSDSLLTALEDLSEERATDPNLNWYLGYAHAGLGHRAEAIRFAERTALLLATSNNALRTAFIQQHVILIYAMVGEHGAAMDQIEYLLSVPSGISVPYLRAAQYPGSLREHPRFQALLEKYEN